MVKTWFAGFAFAASIAVNAQAAELTAQMRQTTPTGPGDALGTVTISEGSGGASIKTALKGLPAGPAWIPYS